MASRQKVLKAELADLQRWIMLVLREQERPWTRKRIVDEVLRMHGVIVRGRERELFTEQINKALRGLQLQRPAKVTKTTEGKMKRADL